MVKVTYTKASTGSLLGAGTKKVGKVPFGNLKMKAAKPRSTPGQVTWKEPMKSNVPQYKVPKTLQKNIKKNGFTKNYSK